MESAKLNLYKHLSLIFFAVTGLLAIVILVVTFIHKDLTSVEPLIFWTIEYHYTITVALTLVAIALGYGISLMTYKELRKTKEESRSLMQLLFLFLSVEEKSIINYLVQHEGSARQSDIARLDNMNRVKAFRTLQRLESRGLVEIAAHGKIRQISLKPHVLHMLQEN